MTAPARSLVHERLATLADATRCRLLLALDGRELTVGELCQAVQLPQSTVSRHLRVLADAGWTSSRAEGASRWYGLAPALDEHARDLWLLVRASVEETPAALQDAARVEAVVSARRARSEAFFADAAGEWDATRRRSTAPAPTCRPRSRCSTHAGRWATWAAARALLSAALAPMVQRVIAVDASPAMLEAATARTAALANVEVRRGHLEALPLRRCGARRGAAHAGAASRGRARARAARGSAGAAAGRPAARVRHASARARGVPADDGACVARFRRAAYWPTGVRRRASTARGYVPLPVDRSVSGPALFVLTATAHAMHDETDETGSGRRGPQLMAHRTGRACNPGAVTWQQVWRVRT